MDEPLSNLDAKLRVQMRAELLSLHQRLGITTIYVTHDQTEAMTLGDRVVVMRHGVVQQVDAPERLYRKPANMFVAGFIGSPAMNFVQGTLANGRVVLGEHSVALPSANGHSGPVVRRRPPGGRRDRRRGATHCPHRSRSRSSSARRCSCTSTFPD